MTNNRFSSFDTLVKDAKLRSRTFSVADDYRTSPLSHTPGGSRIKVVYSDGSARVYDKIKCVAAYVRYLDKSSNSGIVDVKILDDDDDIYEFVLN